VTDHPKIWDHETAVAMCRKIEKICPAYGCHVALTGGTLYKDGLRKDCDILFYRIRQVKEIDVVGLFDALELIDIKLQRACNGWVYKATYQGKPIDCFFPEAQELSQDEYERLHRDDMPLSSFERGITAT